MLSRTIKVKLYDTLIVPVLIYGVEAFSLTVSSEGLLDMFERKVLKIKYSPVYVDGEWRTRYDYEL